VLQGCFSVSVDSFYIEERGPIWLFIEKLKIGVDGVSNLSIIRTSSGAGRTKNSLIINELDGSVSEEEVSMRLIESGEKR
jgi:hypothetical protein